MLRIRPRRWPFTGHVGETPCAERSFSVWSQPCPLYKTRYIELRAGEGEVGLRLALGKLPSCQKGRLLKTFPLIRVK